MGRSQKWHGVKRHLLTLVLLQRSCDGRDIPGLEVISENERPNLSAWHHRTRARASRFLSGM